MCGTNVTLPTKSPDDRTGERSQVARNPPTIWFLLWRGIAAYIRGFGWLKPASVVPDNTWHTGTDVLNKVVGERGRLMPDARDREAPGPEQPPLMTDRAVTASP